MAAAHVPACATATHHRQHEQAGVEKMQISGKGLYTPVARYMNRYAAVPRCQQLAEGTNIQNSICRQHENLHTSMACYPSSHRPCCLVEQVPRLQGHTGRAETGFSMLGMCAKTQQHTLAGFLVHKTCMLMHVHTCARCANALPIRSAVSLGRKRTLTDLSASKQMECSTYTGACCK